MLGRGTKSALLLCLLTFTGAQAQNGGGKILPALKAQTAKHDMGQPADTKPKKPPIILHVTKTLPIMRAATTPPDNDNPDEINPLYSKSPLTVIKEKNTPQGLDIAFIGSAPTPEVPDPEPEIATDGPRPANESPLGSGENYHDVTSSYSSVDPETGYNPNDSYPYTGYDPGVWAGGWAGGTDMLPSYIHEVPGWGFNFVGATPAISQTRSSGLRRDSDIYDSGDNYSSGDIYDHMLYPQAYP